MGEASFIWYTCWGNDSVEGVRAILPYGETERPDDAERAGEEGPDEEVCEKKDPPQ